MDMEKEHILTPRRWRNGRTVGIRAILAMILCGCSTGVAEAQFTPPEWRQPVRDHVNGRFIGQRKHVSWARDANRDFLDDSLATACDASPSVKVTVGLNQALPMADVQAIFTPFGELVYVGRLVTYIILKDVNCEQLPSLAETPEVALVQWSRPLEPQDDVSNLAVGVYPASLALPGTGPTVAVVDTGVHDAHDSLAGKFVAGFNAVAFNSLTDVIDGTCPASGVLSPNPDDVHGHGTSVASVAVGQGSTPNDCRLPPGSTSGTCAGVTPTARLADVRACSRAGATVYCEVEDVSEALEWIVAKRRCFDLRVVNMSLALDVIGDDDGTSPLAQLVDSVVSRNVVVVAALGKPTGGACGVCTGQRYVPAPGSASFAITVGATYDQGTPTRDDDALFTHHLRGPRRDFTTMEPNLLALKPDIVAPGENVFTARWDAPSSDYVPQTGTSIAAPHVAGGAALVIQSVPTITAGSVKDLLLRTADKQKNTPAFSAIDPHWDTGFGHGMLDLKGALGGARTSDVGFPTCIGPPSSPGRPCALGAGLPRWNNSIDIRTLNLPEAGVLNQIVADLKNTGASAAEVTVRFYVSEIGAGAPGFYYIDSVKVQVPAGATAFPVAVPWTPADASHQCIKVEVDFGMDSSYDNNVTQRNLSLVTPGTSTLLIWNPFMRASRFFLESDVTPGWSCEVETPQLDLPAPPGPPVPVKVSFGAPEGAGPGSRAHCVIAVSALPRGSSDRVPVGGVSYDIALPEACRVIGYVVDAAGRPIADAEVGFFGYSEDVRGRTDPDGILMMSVYAGVAQDLEVLLPEGDVARGTVVPKCGMLGVHLRVADGEISSMP